MNLVFPFKNLTYNSLLQFFEQDKIQHITNELARNPSENIIDTDSDIDFYHKCLPNFENEILQIINTTTQETIDSFFTDLSTETDNLRDLIDKEYFMKQIAEWDATSQKEYDKLVENNTEEYFKQEERSKYRHLEEYEGYEPINPFALFETPKYRKTQIVNHNFYCITETPILINLGYTDKCYAILDELVKNFITISDNYGRLWRKGEVKSKAEKTIFLKPIVFFEGDHDLAFINKAATLLNKTDLLGRIEVRQRGSCNNLDKLWSILTENNWETSPQIKILIYDCDANRSDEDFGHVYRRTIPLINGHTIKRGIENLFPKATIERAIKHKNAFVDFKETKGTKRGEPYVEEINVINKDEKKNFCEWACDNGTEEDFTHFKIIFDIIEGILNISRS